MRARLRLSAAAVLALALAGSGCERERAWPLRIVVSLAGAAGRPVHGLDLTVALPTGTTVAHDAATRRISGGALSTGPAAAAATLDGRFSPHATAPSVRLLLASGVPMRDGAVASFDATVRSPIAPPRGRFEMARVAVAGADGRPVPGATGWVSAVDPR